MYTHHTTIYFVMASDNLSEMAVPDPVTTIDPVMVATIAMARDALETIGKSMTSFIKLGNGWVLYRLPVTVPMIDTR